MKVEHVILSNGKTRYMLVDKNGEPIQPVLQYLRFKDNSNAARNTLRSYCFHLKLFFEFLEQEELDYREIGIDQMASFMGWLQNPYGNNKVVSISISILPRKPRTINTVLATVIGFYDYLMRHEDYSIQLSERLKKQITGSRRNFKDFLYHINKDKKFTANILKAKVPKEKPKVISKEQVTKLIFSCSNIRDRFLIQLLWESSMRIGEALSLWLEDFQVDARKIHICDRGELENFAEIKTVYSPRIIDVSEELMDLYFEYIAEIHTDEVDTNHVFIKLSGENKHRPLEYTDVVSLFNRLKKKTAIHVTPHMLRHTSLTELRKSGWKDEHLMKRAGHAHIQTTIQMYVHPSDDDLRKDWERTQERMKINSQKGDS
ncbi:tyrosine-type recombinase/integrase [Bacillus thuringiensis]|uniref:tyrosine-type recombinase/integrase n=1 Tax=Bacillus thuringiensis TaxID=1428 RepID=UPI000BFDD78E|nr:tyrosine-type recombinase/integrase [Bacillus thuringiensis]PGW72462.1 transposase [Bacillus thuringiensis]